MGFGLNLTTGVDFLPIAKIDARTGQIFRVDRSDDGEQEAIDITDRFEAAFDFGHGEVGWAYFQEGQPPEFVMVPIGKPLPKQPSKNHRQGVRLRVMLSMKAASGTERLREVTTTAKSVMRGLEAMYEAWLAGRKQNPSQTLLARLADVRPVISTRGGQKSTNYEPIFAIVRWVKIPAEFEMPPLRPASTPNDVGATAAYPASAREKSAPVSPRPTAFGPAAEADEWG